MPISLRLTLKAIKAGDFHCYTGAFTYAAVLNGIRQISPELVNELNETDGFKTFTVSALLMQGRRYVDKVNPGGNYDILISFLEDRSFNAFYTYVINMLCQKTKRIYYNFIYIGEVPFEIVSLNVGKIAQWDEFIKPTNRNSVELNFYTPTSFCFGERYYIFPDSSKIIESLGDKWNAHAPKAYAIEKDKIEELKQILYPIKYNIHSTIVITKNYMINSFLGQCVYEFDKDADNTQKDVIYGLIQFGSYSGMGYKTTMGMGRYWVK